MPKIGEELVNKWTREYHGFESLNDLIEDICETTPFAHLFPESEWAGTLKITLEYYDEDPDPEMEEYPD